jgi:PEP-CTERM motif
MTQRMWLLAAIGCVVISASQANAQILLQDNFDSYPDQASFQATWPAGGGFASGTLSNAQANSAPNSVLDSGTVAMRNDRPLSSAYTPVSGAPLRFQFAFFDSNAAAAAYRQASTIVSGTANASGQLISLGMNNNISGQTLYSARVLGFDGGTGAGNFFQLTGTPTRTTGWHTLAAVIGTDGTTNSINFFVDGVQSSIVATGFTLRSYDTVRLGTGLTATQPAAFDDVSVQIVSAVPEPSTLALAGLGLGGLTFRRLRRKA